MHYSLTETSLPLCLILERAFHLPVVSPGLVTKEKIIRFSLTALSRPPPLRRQEKSLDDAADLVSEPQVVSSFREGVTGTQVYIKVTRLSHFVHHSSTLISSEPTYPILKRQPLFSEKKEKESVQDDNLRHPNRAMGPSSRSPRRPYVSHPHPHLGLDNHN